MSNRASYLDSQFRDAMKWIHWSELKWIVFKSSSRAIFDDGPLFERSSCSMRSCANRSLNLWTFNLESSNFFNSSKHRTLPGRLCIFEDESSSNHARFRCAMWRNSMGIRCEFSANLMAILVWIHCEFGMNSVWIQCSRNSKLSELKTFLTHHANGEQFRCSYVRYLIWSKSLNNAEPARSCLLFCRSCYCSFATDRGILPGMCLQP